MGKIAHLIRCITTYISPELNTKLCYRVKFGRKLDLNNPQTMNEKILWLKLNRYMNDPLIKKCVDKYRVREYIQEKGCGEILSNLYGVYNSPEEIEWEHLPSKFALKFNIGCGANLICTDKTQLNISKTIKQIQSWFRKKFYLEYSEMQYKGGSPKVLVEEFIGGENKLPADYKFFCMNGKAEYVMVCLDRGSTGGTKYCMYDREWNWCRFDKTCISDPMIKKPHMIEKAFEYADILSAGFSFVRTDLYIVDGKIYFGELTFTPAGGMDFNIFSDVDLMLGEKIVL